MKEMSDFVHLFQSDYILMLIELIFVFSLIIQICAIKTVLYIAY